MSNIDEMMDAQDERGYQVVVVNIKYGKVHNPKIKERPDMTVLDIPEGILRTIKNEEKFKDNIESFAYNTITRKYGAEVSYCQVWLPMD